jgi:hypothetical protein
MAVIGHSAVVAFTLALAGCSAEAGEAPHERGSEEVTIEVSDLRYEVRDVPANLTGYSFLEPFALTSAREVLGRGSRCDSESETPTCTTDAVSIDLEGDFRVLAQDFGPQVANAHGDVGGCFSESPTRWHAAIIHADGDVELLSHPDELFSCVNAISPAGTAFVSGSSGTEADPIAFDEVVLGEERLAVELGEGDHVVAINDRGELAGNFASDSASGQAAARYDARTGVHTLLAGMDCDPTTRAFGVDQQGNVLGYSFSAGSEEHIGTWNQANAFSTLFTEGTAQFPTRSAQLTWNRDGLVFVSRTTDERTYLIAKPGVRVDLASLVATSNAPTRLAVLSVNERGDFLAFSFPYRTYHVFLRTD